MQGKPVLERLIVPGKFKLGVLFSCALTLFFVVPTAEASYMSCLEKSKGRILRWNSSWDADKRDNGVEYRIVNVSIYNRLPDRSVTLTLQSLKSASLSNRTYKVETEEKARSLCERLIVEQRPLVLPHEIRRDAVSQPSGAAVSADVQDLPFIRFTSEGWVRDFPPVGQVLDICRVLDQRFSCLRDEKARFSSALVELEEDFKARVDQDIP